MANLGTRREMLERLIVSELISKRGEGPLARKHFARVPRMLATALPANEVAAQPEGGASEPDKPTGSA
ncbi:MAG: hypothetical protein JWN04_3967 [Myxococcaceae bacterium]|nr:hypothetical protein [Myxococcaceae bacterium]